ncbi:MAG: hypothetical protein LUG27_06145 [Clostridiales bacterium]|nr:hypothetical protein [Clostridiales bacterium]
MGIFVTDSKEKGAPEPQYYRSATNMQVVNYKVYYMSGKEKMLYFLVAFAVGAAVGYLFYGGLAKDEYSQATLMTYVLNIVISVAVGIVAGKLFMPIRTKQIVEKRRKDLTRQFRDMLDGLTTSLGAGNNVVDSLYAAYHDLQIQYEEDALILKEMEVIIAGVQNNVPIEDLFYDFGTRSNIDDIKSFAEVFRVSYRKGGNIRDIIQNTYTILNDKLEIREDIETIVTSGKTEQNLMIVMPIILIALIKFMSPEFAANFATATGVFSTTVAIICFIVAYFIGKMILDIRI